MWLNNLVPSNLVYFPYEIIRWTLNNRKTKLMRCSELHRTNVSAWSTGSPQHRFMMLCSLSSSSSTALPSPSRTFHGTETVLQKGTFPSLWMRHQKKAETEYVGSKSETRILIPHSKNKTFVFLITSTFYIYTFPAVYPDCLIIFMAGKL